MLSACAVLYPPTSNLTPHRRRTDASTRMTTRPEASPNTGLSDLAAASPTPVASTLLFTAINSGAGVATSGIYYLTDQTYGFTRTQNYALGVVLGATYIAGALGAGPALRVLRGAVPGLSMRTVLAALMVVMGLLCLIPITAMRMLPAPEAGALPAAWPIWVFVTLYSPLTGVLWPIVESYVSGGKRSGVLRRTIGWWNVTWSGSLVISTVALAPFVENAAAEAIAAIFVAHLIGAALLITFAREPQAHLQDDAHTVPPVFAKLLVTFRMLLPMSYLVATALTPFLPSQFTRLGIAANLFTVFGSVWLLARVACFLLMQQSSHWHGRWWPAIVAPIVLLTGFGTCVLAHQVPGLGAGVVVLGLVCFGLGMAAIYCGAIYYAMEVGSAEVEAGGAHEALIGVGYTAGPLCGLAAGALVSFGLIPEYRLEPVLLAGVGGIAVLVAIATARRVALQTRQTRSSPLPAA